MENGNSIDEIRRSFKNERRSGDSGKAYSIAKKLLKHKNVELSDFFSAGELALRLHLFSEVVSHLSEVIRISENIGEEYYLDQSYFWRAYSQYKINEFRLAIEDIEMIKEKNNVFYVYSIIPEKEVFEYGVQDLVDMIKAANV